MPIVCKELSPDTLDSIHRRLERAPPSHPLRTDSLDGTVTVWSHKGFLIYHSASGYYFQRIVTDVETTLLEDVSTDRSALCTSYHILDEGQSSELVKKLHDRYTELHGEKARMIESVVVPHNDKLFALFKLPAFVVRHMMAPSGGQLRTTFSGKLPILRQIPILAQFKCVPETGDSLFGSSLVTSYTAGYYEPARALHWGLVQQVIQRPNSGITLKDVGLWIP
jgi:hypothetical protein